MLPSSRKYLTRDGFVKTSASWILLACFMGGFIGIQIVSRFLHEYIPSQVVDCDHNHEEPPHSHRQSGSQSHAGHSSRHHSSHAKKSSHATNGKAVERNGQATEGTPLLSPGHQFESPAIAQTTRARGLSQFPNRRPSMVQVQQKVVSFMKDTKNDCDEGGPCFGYSEPCGRGCLKSMFVKMPNSRRPTFGRSKTLDPTISAVVEEQCIESGTASDRSSRPHSPSLSDDSSSRASDLEAQHHHHVPENPFMSIGLQTSIAIALHKLPEGFLTFATNHANPSLGFSVFMALFVHNISEGFSLALPLYLALGSRFKAMAWSSLLGGLSQPLGAALAATWFKLAGRSEHKPGHAVYGCMFAVTAGIMTSVALSLFTESLSLNHNKNLCVGFAFVGMVLMGMSNALTA